MSPITIVLLVTGYFLLSAIGTTIFLALTEDAEKLTDAPDLGISYILGLLWPWALICLLLYALIQIPKFACSKLYKAIRWARLELTNPKENVPDNSDAIPAMVDSKPGRTYTDEATL